MWKILLFEVVVVLLGVGIWLGAPLIGITSVPLRVLIILALVLPPVIYLIVKMILNRKAAKGLEEGLKQQGSNQQAGARPGNAEEIAILNENFQEAVSALKSSKIGGTKGTALYALPWYMIIGPPAAGKSTALLRSGLNFPYTSSSGKKSIKGVGGTRNCDWWFADQAILLDTAGRYTTEEEDYEEWVEFLRLLKRYRKKRPLNGLIVCIAISDLLTVSKDEVEEIAARLRSRLDQVISELEMIVPVYVLLSKCDLLNGFVEFFGDFKRSKRAQVLGFTTPLTTPKQDIGGLFSKEFDILLDSLQKRMMNRLPAARPEERGGVYQFPLQFEETREALTAFLNRLFVYNPYQETPRMRGVYFCSGTQEGRPLDRVMNRISSALGLGAMAPGTAGEEQAKKSYFLHDLFIKVLFPDKTLAGTTASSRSRRWRIRLATMIVSLLVAIGGISASTITFTRNRSLVSGTVQMAETTKLESIRDTEKLLKNLEALDKLGKHNEQLRDYNKDHPWSYNFGYYSGEQVVGPSEAVFARRMYRIFADLTGMELEASLADINLDTWKGTTDEVTRGYDLLKAYLMVTQPGRLDVKFTLPVLLGEWKKRLPPEVSSQHELLERNARRYLELRKKGVAQAAWLEPTPALVDQVRKRLLDADVLYKRSIEALGLTMPPYTLRDALQGRVETKILSKHQVPGLFTKEGYDKVKSQVKKTEGEAWVLWSDESVKSGDKLLERYYEKYNDAWRKFLEGISLAPPQDRNDSLAILDKITGSPSLYEVLLKSVLFQTDFSPKLESGMLQTAVERRGGKARKLLKGAQALGLDDAAKKRAAEAHKPNKVEIYFKELSYMVSPPPAADGTAQVSGLKQYLDEVAKVREEMAKIPPGSMSTNEFALATAEARRVTERVLKPLDVPLRSALSHLFYDPLGAAKSVVDDEGDEGMKSSFRNEVCAAFNDLMLSQRYPFANKSEDALFQDVVKLFSPTEGMVWKYYEKTLKDLLVLQGKTYEVAPGRDVPGGIRNFYNKAHALTQALFPPGSAAPSFTFSVRPAQPILAEGSPYFVEETRLEIDGTVMSYRNGPRDWYMFTWPGADRKEARLTVRGEGVSEQIIHQGDWALQRLIEDAKVTRAGSWYRMEWTFRDAAIRVQMEFKPQRSENPFSLRKQQIGEKGMTCP